MREAWEPKRRLIPLLHTRPIPVDAKRGYRRFFACLLALPIVALALAGQAAPRSFRLEVPAGTRLSVCAVQDVVTNKIKSGQMVELKVTRGVTIKGVKVIAASAPARGVILYSRGSGVGFRGEMMMGIQDVQAVDGTWIPLRAQAARGNGLAKVIPESNFDTTAPVFPSGKNIRLSHNQVFDVFTDGKRDFMVTGSRVTEVPPARVQRKGIRVVKIADGATVRVHPAMELKSSQVNTGDSIDFVVIAPVMVGQTTVIAENAPAKGTVLLARKAGMGNKGGLLVLSIDKVQAVDGSWVRLSEASAGRGSSNKAYSAAISVLVPVVGLAVNGREMVVKQDKEFAIYIYDDHYVGVPVNK